MAGATSAGDPENAQRRPLLPYRKGLEQKRRTQR